jgi:hypothetical protein
MLKSYLYKLGEIIRFNKDVIVVFVSIGSIQLIYGILYLTMSRNANEIFGLVHTNVYKPLQTNLHYNCY